MVTVRAHGESSVGNWHNALLPADVNGDGVVAATDLLVLLTWMNETGFADGRGPLPRDPAPVSQSFLDTSGDGYFTPIDVLSVINHLEMFSGEYPIASQIRNTGIAPGNLITAWSLRDDDHNFSGDVAVIDVDRIAPERPSWWIIESTSDDSTTHREPPRSWPEQEIGENLTNMMAVRLEVVDSSDTPVSHIRVGDEFSLNLYVSDLTDPKVTGPYRGVFAAYVDIQYDASFAESIGPPNHGTIYVNANSGDAEIPGLINEIGGFSGAMRGHTQEEILLASVSFRATQSGQMSFAADPADVIPAHEPFLFGGTAPVPNGAIELGKVTLSVVAPDPLAAG